MAGDSLEHYGVKGMKWGRRKARPSHPLSEDHTTYSDLRKRPASSLSNRELQKLNERGNLLRNYNKMNPSKIAKGRKTVTGIIAGATAAVGVYNLVNSNGGKAFIKAGKNAYFRHLYNTGRRLAITAG